MSDNKTTDTIAMHFRHSTTVDELVNKLRAHYVWNEKDDLPEWIAEPLKDFPLLASYAQTLLQTLRSIPTSFGDQEATEYDLLVNCMIIDQIMTSCGNLNCTTVQLTLYPIVSINPPIPFRPICTGCFLQQGKSRLTPLI